MIIEKIKNLPLGAAIPKPRAIADFKIDGWGTRRGEPALIYAIPNHRNPGKPWKKGITLNEFNAAYAELNRTGQFTRRWFNVALEHCAKEGACNFTTVGGIFKLLGIARYAGKGRYEAC